MARMVKPLRRIHTYHPLRRARTIIVKVHVMRAESSQRSRAFVACAYLKTGGMDRAVGANMNPKLRGSCGFGSNPRKATAGALRKAASHFSKRSGAYAGLAGYSKKNRRVRRTRRAGKRKG